MRAIITVGLGFGDEGKGACVDALCRQYNSKLVIRYSGGMQAGHNVVLKDGTRHTFSQFGAGTFAGASTYLDQGMIIEPIAMQREANHLVKCGIASPYELFKVHPRCLVSTQFHRTMNHLKEAQLGHGSCGQGIGETRSYWLRYGEDAIFAEDLEDHQTLLWKLELLRERMLADPFMDGCWTGSYTMVELNPIQIAKDMVLERPHLNIRNVPYLERTEDEVIVFEGAQGMLLDQRFGGQPHTTWSDVTPRLAHQLCDRLGIEERKTIGITRAYHTRHGTGPLPTYNEELEIPDQGNPYNIWQGDIRFGCLDMELLQYAARCLEWYGYKLDGLAVNCLDQLPKVPFIIAAPRQNTPNDAVYDLSKLLKVPIDGYWECETYKQLLKHLHDSVAKPVILGFGETAEDREFLEVL
jgi:adenylosuccinate synthase